MANRFIVDLETLNAGFGSNASGVALVTINEPTANTRTVRVQIDAEGLEDVSALGGVHVAHIHGQFESNLGLPPAEQRDGSFFEGIGGTAVDSVVPTLADDANGNGFINFLEGLPSYGPVVLNLTEPQLADLEGVSYPPDGTPPLSYFLELVGSGEIDPAALFPSGTEFNLDETYEFDLTDPDQLRQFNNLSPLDQREIVLHGLTIPLDISNAIDAVAPEGVPRGVEVPGTNEAFRITAPVAAGTISPFEISADTGFTEFETVGNDLARNLVFNVDPFPDSLEISRTLQVTTTLTDGVQDLGTEAQFKNLVGLYEVANAQGQINVDTNEDGIGDTLLNPGDDGYARAAIENRVDNFRILAGASGDPTFNTTAEEFEDVLLNGGRLYAPFIIANGASVGFDGFIANENAEASEFNDAADFREDLVAYFAFVGANPDNADHLQSRGNGVFGFEDLPSNLGISDNDFNDAVFQLAFNA